MFLARQSGEVSVQDQNERTTTLLRRSPRPTVVVDKLNVRKQVADSQRHGVFPCRWSGDNRRRPRRQRLTEFGQIASGATSALFGGASCDG